MSRNELFLMMLLAYFYLVSVMAIGGFISLINSDFEDDFISGYNYIAPSSWNVNRIGSVIIASNNTQWGGGAAPSGSYYLALQTIYSSTWTNIYQSITIPANSVVKVSLYARSRPHNSYYNNTHLTGLSINFDTTIITKKLSTAWIRYSFNISASSSVRNKPLKISGNYQSCNQSKYECTIELDDIEITCGAVGTNCFQCNPGKYLSSNNNCTLCEQGTYNNLYGRTNSSDCIKCAAGKYNPNSGSISVTTCISCSPGKYLTTTGGSSESACIHCPKGKYNANYGSAIECLSCPTGTYGVTTTRMNCTQCGLGTYNPYTGSTSASACIKCETGKYNSFYGVSICTSCAAGKYNFNTGGTDSSFCNPCNLGSYSSNSGQSQCTSCVPGKYNSNFGSNSESACTLCGINTYSINSGSTTSLVCTACPNGKHNPILGSSTESACIANFPSSQPSVRPSLQPSKRPIKIPSLQPTNKPTSQPLNCPSSQPYYHPSRKPSTQPSTQPKQIPSTQPSDQPSYQPSFQPSRKPSFQPTSQPSTQPSRYPTKQPTKQPTCQPSIKPTLQPSSQPSCQPTIRPSLQPSNQPSKQPTKQPTSKPSKQPSSQPSKQPTYQPSNQPSYQPSNQPTSHPSFQSTMQPTKLPSKQPSMQPSIKPSTQPSMQPSSHPSIQPTRIPSAQPTRFPTLQPSSQPTRYPSSQPSSCPSKQPSKQPVKFPTTQPSSNPSRYPTRQPSIQPSMQPYRRPSKLPSCRPSIQPSIIPTVMPTKQPDLRLPSVNPTNQPTTKPSLQPQYHPSLQPSSFPTERPFNMPSYQPSKRPVENPTDHPSTQPSTQPSIIPSFQSSSQPSTVPTLFVGSSSSDATVLTVSLRSNKNIINCKETIKLIGEITTSISDSTFLVNGKWSLHKFNNISELMLVSDQPTYSSFSMGGKVLENQLYLTVKTQTMSYGRTYTFILKCSSTIASKKYSSFGSLSIYINSPPTKGYFNVDPKEGFELTDKFNFVSLNWGDIENNLPLTFEFGFMTLSNIYNILQYRSLSSSFNDSYLTVGQRSRNFELVCLSQIFDYLDANTTISYRVNVYPSNKNQLSVLESVRVGLSTIQYISLSTSVINSIDCTNSPNCTNLNRNSCGKLPNKCGSCISDKYVGEDGESNEPCLAAMSYTNRPLSKNCNTSKDCLHSFNDCINGYCILPNKSCPSNCSSNGICRFENINTGLQVPQCPILSADCVAVCLCFDLYQGTESCYLSIQDQTIRHNVRVDILKNIETLIKIQTPKVDLLDSWINSMISITQVPEELKEMGLDLTFNITRMMIRTGKDLSIDSKTSFNIIYIINSIVNSFAILKFSDSNITNSQFYSDLLVILISEFCELLLQDTLPGDIALNLNLNQIRFLTMKIYKQVDSNVSISLPRTKYEIMNNYSDVSFVIPFPKLKRSDIFIYSMKSKLFNGQNSNSNPVFLKVDPIISCQNIVFTVALDNSKFEDFSTQVSDEYTDISCSVNHPKSLSYRCSNGFFLNKTCSGMNSEIRHYYCPNKTQTVSCNANLNSNNPINQYCEVNEMSESKIKCSCKVLPFANCSRKLSLLRNTSTSNIITLTSNLGVQYSDEMNMFTLTVDKYSYHENNANILIIYTILSVGIVILTLMVFIIEFSIKRSEFKIASEKKKKVKKSSKTVIIDSTSQFLNIMEKCFPVILQEKSFFKRLIIELKNNHPLLRLFNIRLIVPRWAQVISLSLCVISFLFIQSLVYIFTNQDNNMCTNLNDESSCISVSSFGISMNQYKCYWSIRNNKGTCYFGPGEYSFHALIVVTILSAIINIPCCLWLEWLVIQLFNSPMKKVQNKIDKSGDQLDNPNDQQVSSLISAMELEKLVSYDLASLNSELKLFRKSLTEKQRTYFDDAWELDADGNFDNNILTKKKNDIFCLKSLPSMKDYIISDLSNIHKVMDTEYNILKNQLMLGRREYVNQKMIFIFLFDTLSDSSRAILSGKYYRDSQFIIGDKLSKAYILILSAFTGFLWIGMIVYTVMFSMSQPDIICTAWIESFILWLIIYFIFVSNIKSIVFHVILPSTLIKEIFDIRNDWLDCIVKFTKTNRKRTVSNTFNSANYLFLSTRLAALLPELKESKLIQYFSSNWPLNKYHGRVSQRKNKCGSFLFRSIESINISALSAPIVIQDFFLLLISFLIIGLALFYTYELFLIKSIWILVLITFVLLLVHFLIKSCPTPHLLAPIDRISPLISPDYNDILCDNNININGETLSISDTILMASYNRDQNERFEESHSLSPFPSDEESIDTSIADMHEEFSQFSQSDSDNVFYDDDSISNTESNNFDSDEDFNNDSLSNSTYASEYSHNQSIYSDDRSISHCPSQSISEQNSDIIIYSEDDSIESFYSVAEDNQNGSDGYDSFDDTL